MKRPRLAWMPVAMVAASAMVGFLMGRWTAPPSSSTAGLAPAIGPIHTALPRVAADRIPTKDRIESLDRESDPLKRFTLAIRQLEDWVREDPRGALEWLARQPVSGRRNEIIQMAVAQWAEIDPSSAADWAKNQLHGLDKNNVLIRIAENWALTDPASAARWFNDLPDPQDRGGPLEGLFFRWASHDARAAHDFLRRELADAPERPTLTQAMLAGWAKTDPLGAVTLSLEISRHSGNPALFANTIANWATVDPTASAAWLLNHVPPGPQRDAAVPELAAMFAHLDPASGLQWIEDLPAQEKSAAHSALAAAWARNDPSAAARWLAASPTSPPLEEDARNSILLGYLAADENGFRDWKNSLPPGSLRESAERLSALPE